LLVRLELRAILALQESKLVRFRVKKIPEIVGREECAEYPPKAPQQCVEMVYSCAENRMPEYRFLHP
jgi:hypothetical protein